MKFFTQPVAMPLWLFGITVFTAWMGIIVIGHNVYDYWTVTRPLHNCIEHQISRCEIGDSVIHLNYQPTEVSNLT